MARSERLKADEIFGAVRDEAQDELGRSSSSLAFSGLAAGLVLSFSVIGTAALTAAHPGASTAFTALLYPVGFVAVVIGRAQLFTENSLYPVVVVLKDRRQLGGMLRLWAIVLVANIVGAFLFAILATKTPALEASIRTELVSAGARLLGESAASQFWKGIVAGWLIAFAAWLVTAADSTIARIAVVFAVVYLIGLGSFPHSIAGSSETLSMVLDGGAGIGDYLRWLAIVAAGNIVGGVVIVTLVNYGQVDDAF
ncbi:MAG: formate/nitrite transporter family protein [Actinomycetota bacterium]